jgi:YidC/Oxa1 family membrane protein insertase
MAMADVQRMQKARRSGGVKMDIDFVKPVEMGIELLAGGLRSVGVPQSYGPAIIAFTLGLKALTFPLNKQQIESTTKMQAIAPAAKKLQDRYRNKDPARLNMELQKLYAENEVNPLAGCLPALAQIPIFIVFYRALLRLAEDDLLQERFLWIPSLEGPVRNAQEGIGWLTNWVDGAPKYGWEDTAAYLVLPVVLTLSQYASTALIAPKQTDPSQEQSTAILKFLPLLIGWFSLNVPQGLGLYWLANNFATTATTLLIRRSVGEVQLVGGAVDVTKAAEPIESKGFGRKYGEVVQRSVDPGTGSKVKITPPAAKSSGPATIVDAEVVADPTDTVATATATVEASDPDAPRTLRKKKSKKKKR